MGRKKKKTHVRPVQEVEDDTKKRAKSLVFKKGDVSPSMKQLVQEFRKVMEPNTAVHLKEKKMNTIKDFVAVSGPLGITHFFIFSSTEVGSYMKIGTVPHGPTVTFRILEYSLSKDIKNIQENPHSLNFEYKTEPILVLSGFTDDDKKYELTKNCFKQAFPSVNVNTIKLDECKRVVLVVFDKETERIHLRHYLITTKPTGVSQPIKDLLHGKNFKFGQYEDISEYILDDNNMKEDNNDVIEESIMPFEEKNKLITQKAIRLVEIGPRMELLLIKVEEKLCSGLVWYHRYVNKTPEEIEKQNQIIEQRRILKEKRKQQQQMNVLKKQQKNNKSTSKNEEVTQTPEDNIEWYKKEVGEEPEEDDKKYLKNTSQKKNYNPPAYRNKRKREDNDKNSKRNSDKQPNKKGNDKQPNKKRNSDKQHPNKKRRTNKR